MKELLEQVQAELERHHERMSELRFSEPMYEDAGTHFNEWYAVRMAWRAAIDAEIEFFKVFK